MLWNKEDSGVLSVSKEKGQPSSSAKLPHFSEKKWTETSFRNSPLFELLWLCFVSITHSCQNKTLMAISLSTTFILTLFSLLLNTIKAGIKSRQLVLNAYSGRFSSCWVSCFESETKLESLRETARWWPRTPAGGQDWNQSASWHCYISSLHSTPWNY